MQCGTLDGGDFSPSDPLRAIREAWYGSSECHSYQPYTGKDSTQRAKGKLFSQLVHRSSLSSTAESIIKCNNRLNLCLIAFTVCNCRLWLTSWSWKWVISGHCAGRWWCRNGSLGERNLLKAWKENRGRTNEISSVYLCFWFPLYLILQWREERADLCFFMGFTVMLRGWNCSWSPEFNYFLSYQYSPPT